MAEHEKRWPTQRASIKHSSCAPVIYGGRWLPYKCHVFGGKATTEKLSALETLKDQPAGYLQRAGCKHRFNNPNGTGNSQALRDSPHKTSHDRRAPSHITRIQTVDEIHLKSGSGLLSRDLTRERSGLFQAAI